MAPLLTVGLPVRNGERFLARALDGLLAQTLTDLEIIISDNASTDATPEIAAKYVALDPRVRYVRQTRDLGAAGNHNAVRALATGRYFAWASDDDLYAPTLFERCLAALEADPELALAHAQSAFVDADDEVIAPAPYLLDTDSPDPAERLRSLLHVSGGNDFYGVARTDLFRRVGPLGSYHNADRVYVAALALRGRFHHVPEVLYFRRDHPDRGERAPGLRARCAGLDPRRADRLRHPLPRLLVEYVLAYVVHICRAPLSLRQRMACLGALSGWLLSRTMPGRSGRIMATTDPAVLDRHEEEPPPPLRVAALGFYGIGNLGNEASLSAFADWVRAEHPDAELSVLAVDPAAVERDHGLPARRLMTYRRDLAGGGPLVGVLKALSRLADVPRLWHLVGRSDAVVVPGSGVLETGLGLRPWGLPYWLFVVALCCRLRGRRFTLVSVGVQPGQDRATRLLHRWTLRLATWVSVRDEGSREAVAADGVHREVAIAPDLVFGRLAPTGIEQEPEEVAVGVMAYYGGGQGNGARALARYTTSVARAVRLLAERGESVTLVVGDLADRPVAEAVARKARTGGSARAARVEGEIRVSPADTLPAVAAELERAEVVVASRFHTLVAALAVGRPVVTLGYAPKSAELQSTYGLPPLRQPIDQIDPELLIAQVERARAADRPSEETTTRMREQLRAQYRELWSVLHHSSERGK
ncbi:glycosyltransferase [Nocardioides sp. BP30]|uniref:glycosyltransferase n=1 Tax=Nocardioides sp. BP30 TaxID=3036374 RepID=UPI002468A83F|nr:glycosyltransferase [Nocardioides sp. BP30]WGL53308.1 glycosyltransferase [Nocardioides sp. BP30]